MAMSREELTTLLSNLTEASDGTRVDDYALMKSEIEELYDDKEKSQGRIDKLEQDNGALRKENFKLFSRVGQKQDDSSNVGLKDKLNEEPQEEESYLKDIINEKGRWNYG